MKYPIRHDGKRAINFFLYKTELQKKRTRKRKRSIFFWIRMREQKLLEKRISNDLFPQFRAYTS
jgi:hypothetical protein